ncbi:hypothetical protein KSP35_14080 [Aquihabitans sp. G128]|uniref:SCO6745 family protein n=1 Tax=Aquihabitans sp. G128 TaxID=2849779 RepID=UPI001C230E9B|nr:hypothetical protein [Aquihabitans sp. G128]QXC59515.1 hypothetical protein KSP35_14080 [Aquihabitans sp. G128]
MAASDAGEDWAAAAARRLWTVYEPIHAVTYFSEACAERYRALGLQGFWMGYFASRSAPFGAASPQLATATFFNFRPSMAERALPDAWDRTTPAAVLAARLDGSVATLRAALGATADGPDVAEAAELAEQAVAACSVEGRALFAALTAVDRPADPLGRLWHAATLLREHRGDGHVAASVAAGLSGLDAHVTFAATDAVPRERLQGARGWTDDEWAAATAGLVERGWLDGEGALTAAGRAGRQEVEDRTGALAAAPWRSLGVEATERLHAGLLPLAQAIVASGAIPFPNPIGVPLPA